MFQYLRSAENRVLIVEKDPARLEALVLAVQSEPELELAAAFRTVGEAIDWLDTGSADILLLDPSSPGEGGISSISECHRRHPSCDVVVLAEAGDADNVLACIEAGASGYLLKGEDTFEGIVRRLKELRHGGAPISSVIVRKLLERVKRKTMASVPPTEGAKDRIGPALTSREKIVLELMARGDTYAEIAEVLSITVRTVETHMKNIYKKLSVHSRGEAVFEAHVHGLLPHWQ